MIVGLIFMAISVYQLNRKSKMDDLIIQNYERKYTVLDRVKLLRIEHTSKAIFGAIVALVGILETLFLPVNNAAIVIVVSVILWQFADIYFKKPYLKKK
jgi:hypothetical protein